MSRKEMVMRLQKVRKEIATLKCAEENRPPQLGRPERISALEEEDQQLWHDIQEDIMREREEQIEENEQKIVDLEANHKASLEEKAAASADLKDLIDSEEYQEVMEKYLRLEARVNFLKSEAQKFIPSVDREIDKLRAENKKLKNKPIPDFDSLIEGIRWQERLQQKSEYVYGGVRE